MAPIGLVEPPAGFSDIRYVAGTAGQPFVEREGPGFGSAADAPQRGRGGAPGGSRRRRTRRARRGAGRAGGSGRGAARLRRRRRAAVAAVWSCRGCRSSSRRTACCPRSTSTRASSCGRCRTATRRTRSAIIPALHGHEHPEDRAARQRRPRRHQDARHPRRSAGHDDAGASARRDAARVRQDQPARKSARSGCRRRRAARR